MLITEILSRNARIYGSEVALIEREPAKNRRFEITWQEFDDQANQIAQILIQKGIKKGDRVVQLMTNCIEWLPIYFGILRTGALVVPLNFRFVGNTIKKCVLTAGAKAMIFGDEFIERLDVVKADLDICAEMFIFIGPDDKRPGFAESCSDLMKRTPARDPEITLSILDDAALYYTSGTTGTPKATLLTHRNLEFACYAENRHHFQTHDDNFLCLPPLYHTGAKMHWFGNFIVGAKAVILKGIDPLWIMEAISEEKVTVVWLLVPWALDILFAIENGDLNLEDYSLDQWRLMHIGAQPVPPSLIKEWLKHFPHHQYDTNYGLTESSGPGCVHLGLDNIHKVGAIGVSGFDWEVRIVDEDLNPVPLGEPGELAVKGPGVMKGYYGNPEATREVLVEDWLLTGDIARQDEQGFFWLVDRKKDVIITGGENIYPVEIEDFLQTHHAIQDVAVIGLHSLRLGEVAAAVIKVKPGKELTKKDIDGFCQALPRYKRPRRIIFGDVPRNPTGKIEKPKLREIYAGSAESPGI
ncbi:MAG: class I adenylate-forming enzyme family protein [bacterium]